MSVYIDIREKQIVSFVGQHSETNTSFKYFIMPLYKMSSNQFGGFQAFFNCNSTNGYMGKHELRAILARFNVNPSNEDLQDMIDMISVDSRGITLQCFMDFVASYQAMRDVSNEYTEAFRIYDRSGTGRITRDDISYVMKKLNVQANVDAIIQECDLNNDGVIEYKEFVKMMSRTF